MPGPHVYANDNANTWAVKLPGACPRVFEAADIIDCEVVEAQPDQAPQRRLTIILGIEEKLFFADRLR